MKLTVAGHVAIHPCKALLLNYALGIMSSEKSGLRNTAHKLKLPGFL